MRPDLVLVDLPCAQAGDEYLPDPALAAAPHRVGSSVPVVEISHHGNPLGIRRPDDERNAARVPQSHGMAAELFVLLEVSALGEEVDVEVGEDAPEAVGVVLLPAMSLGIDYLEAVRKRLLRVGEDRLEHPAGVEPRHLGPALPP